MTDQTFFNLVKAMAFDLRVIERNTRDGLSAGHAERIIENFSDLKAEIAKRGLPAPKMTVPKIKVVRPRR